MSTEQRLLKAIATGRWYKKGELWQLLGDAEPVQITAALNRLVEQQKLQRRNNWVEGHSDQWWFEYATPETPRLL